jgi:hypothetical protein
MSKNIFQFDDLFFIKKMVQQWGQALLSSMLPFIMVVMKRLVPVFNTSNHLLMISLTFGSVHQPIGRSSNLLSLSRISIGKQCILP